MGNHLGNWSRIQETANQISQITEVSHNPRASCTGFKSLYRRKTARMTSLATMTIRYGLILLEAMGTFRESGCLASSILRTFRNKIQKIVSMNTNHWKKNWRSRQMFVEALQSHLRIIIWFWSKISLLELPVIHSFPPSSLLLVIPSLTPYQIKNVIRNLYIICFPLESNSLYTFLKFAKISSSFSTKALLMTFIKQCKSLKSLFTELCPYILPNCSIPTWHAS